MVMVIIMVMMMVMMVIVNDYDNYLESFHGDGDYHDSNDDDQPWLALPTNPLGDHDDY